MSSWHHVTTLYGWPREGHGRGLLCVSRWHHHLLWKHGGAHVSCVQLDCFRGECLSVKYEKRIWKALSLCATNWVPWSLVSHIGISMASSKVQMILEWELFHNVNENHCFQVVNFYRNFIQGFSKIVAPVMHLMLKKVPFYGPLMLKLCLINWGLRFIITHPPTPKPWVSIVVVIDASYYALSWIVLTYCQWYRLCPFTCIALTYCQWCRMSCGIPLTQGL